MMTGIFKCKLKLFTNKNNTKQHFTSADKSHLNFLRIKKMRTLHSKFDLLVNSYSNKI